MTLGFTFRETMRGSYYLLADPTAERPMTFTLEVRAKGLVAFARDPVARIGGTMSLDGFADDASLEGTLAFRISDQHRLVYDCQFEGGDGRRYRFRAQKELTALAPVESLTTLSGSLYDEASYEIGRATLRFDLRGDLDKLLRSFRLGACVG
jgi:hypothetical protein